MTAPGFAPAMARAVAVRRLGQALALCGIDNGALDARLLVCAAATISHADMVRDPDFELGEAAALRLADFAARRLAREPVSRILGIRGFWDFEVLVTPAVLDPRPETEILVEAAREILAPRRMEALRIVDLGTGSGALICALLREFPAARGLAIEICAAACEVARRNLARCGVAARCEIVEGHWTAAEGRLFDLAVANPPYVASDSIATLAPEVRDHDPRLALDGGPDGLQAYRALAPLLASILAPSGIAIVEIGAGQGEAVCALVQAAGLVVAELRRDFSDCDRAIVAFAPPQRLETT